MVKSMQAIHRIPRLLPFHRILAWPVILLFLLTSTALAAPPEPPSPDTDVAAWAKLLYEALTSKSWSVLVGLVLIGLVYPIRRFGPDLFKTAFGGLVIAFAVSLSGTLGAALAVHVELSWALVATSLSTAAAAAGVWEWLKAHIPGMQTLANKSTNTPSVTIPPGVVPASASAVIKTDVTAERP